MKLKYLNYILSRYVGANNNSQGNNGMVPFSKNKIIMIL